MHEVLSTQSVSYTSGKTEPHPGIILQDLLHHHLCKVAQQPAVLCIKLPPLAVNDTPMRQALCQLAYLTNRTTAVSTARHGTCDFGSMSAVRSQEHYAEPT